MMDVKQVALKLVLDQVGEDTDISSVDDRLRLQKTVYLAQAAGINLGYHYSWYLKGPYSTALTQDYYKLSEALSAGDTSHTQRVLNPAITHSIPKIRQLLERPADLHILKHHWYETLASLHFLMSSSKYSADQAKTYLSAVKPHISSYLDRGIQHLRSLGLVHV